jgi:uncharacterized membrane protein
MVAKAFIFEATAILLRLIELSTNIESSKTLAGIGALLLFLSFVPIIGIIGIILLILGMKGLSENYKDESIYQHAIKGLVFGIIGIVAVSVLSILAFVGGFFSIFTSGASGIVGGILLLIAALVIAFIFYLLMAINFRRAFDTIAERSGEQMFHTAGSLLFYGAVLTIIFVGLFLVWIAWIIAAIAFFSMKTTPAQPYNQQPYGYAPPPSPPSPTQPSTGQRYCPNCGAPVDPNATFCPNCGKPLKQ